MAGFQGSFTPSRADASCWMMLTRVSDNVSEATSFSTSKVIPCKNCCIWVFGHCLISSANDLRNALGQGTKNSQELVGGLPGFEIMVQSQTQTTDCVTKTRLSNRSTASGTHPPQPFGSQIPRQKRWECVLYFAFLGVRVCWYLGIHRNFAATRTLRLRFK